MTSIVIIWAVLLSVTSHATDRPLTSLEGELTDLVYDLSRSIVTVEGSRRVSVPSADGIPGEATETLISSGIICDTLGHVLVAAAAVAGQDKLFVEVGERRYPAFLVGVDYFSDLALLTLKCRVGIPARFSQRQVCAGQMVIGIGNAYGLSASPSMGFCAGARPDGNMQFSLPMTASCVGGGVFDLSGQLLGVIVGSLGQTSRVALAVPAYQLPSITSYLLQHGDRLAGYIGVSTADIEIVPPISIANPLIFAGGGNQSSQISQGVVVTYVVPSSPADLAGIKKGDLILGFEKQSITSAASLALMVRRSEPGTPLDVTLLRRNQPFTLRVLVGRKQILASSMFSDVEQFEDTHPSADSLSRLLEYFRDEVSHLETRLKGLR